MARFDLIDEYTSLVLSGTRKTGMDDWPERFGDSHPGVLQEGGKTTKSMSLRSLLLLTTVGAAFGLIRKDFL